MKAQIKSPKGFFNNEKQYFETHTSHHSCLEQMTSQDVEVLLSITSKLILHNKAGLDAN